MTTSTTLPADPTGGAMSALTTNITGWVTTYGLPSLIALLALGTIIRLFTRFVRRGAKSV